MKKHLSSLLTMLSIAAILSVGGATAASATTTTTHDSGFGTAAGCSDDTPAHPDCFVVFVDKVDGKNAYFAVGSYKGGSAGTVVVELSYKSSTKTASKVCQIGKTCAASTSTLAKSGSGNQYMCAKLSFKGGGGEIGDAGPYHKCRVV